MNGVSSTSPLAATRPNAGWNAPALDRASTVNGAVPGGRRRSVPHLLVGALLVVACAVGFAVAAAGVDHRASVLVLTRPVTVGQQLTSGDVRVVRVSAQAGVATIPASVLSQITGEQVAVSLPAGALLTRSELGPVAVPTGEAVVAVAVKAGQAPADLAAGDHVLLVVTQTSTAGAGSAAGSGGPWSGVVTDITAPTAVDETGSTVVSVQLAGGAARAVAALPAGQIDLVLVSGS